jgi:hypothetical protein
MSSFDGWAKRVAAGQCRKMIIKAIDNGDYLADVGRIQFGELQIFKKEFT